MLRYLIILLLTVPLVANAKSEIQTYVVGDTIEPFTLQDQHDKTFSSDESTKFILFTTGMNGGKVVRKAIEKETADYLTKNNTLFISNISGMPGLIAKMIAIPSMKKYEYPIILDKEGKVTEKFPSQKDSVTIIQLDHLKIESINYTNNPDKITQVINQQSN